MEKEKKTLSKNAKIFIYSFTSIILVISFFFIGFFVSKNKYKISAEDQKIIDTYHLLKEEWLYGNELNNFTDEALTSLIEGMSTKENDPYTFYTENEEEQNLSLNGKGFGFSSHYYGGNLIVTNIVNGPSLNKLEVNDIITSIKVDNSTFVLKEHTLEEIQNFLAKERDINTVFTFSFIRNNQAKETSIIKGDYYQSGVNVIKTPNEENDYSMVLKISTFLDTSLTSDVSKNLKQYQNINNLIIDLTDNGGGYVSQAEELAKLFVKKGTLIYQLVDKNDKVLTKSIQNNDPIFNIKNYKIIINNSSASASELFTLAMRKGTDAKIVGLKSYGKGVSQSFKTFSDGSVIRYTKGLVYGPKRDNENITPLDKYNKDDMFSIHKVGITPDIIFKKDFSFLNSFVEMNKTKYLTTNQVDHVIKVINELYPSIDTSSRFDKIIEKYTSTINTKYSLSLSSFTSDNYVTKEVSDMLIKESYDLYLNYKNEMLKEYYND